MLIKNKLSEDYKLHTKSVGLAKLYTLLSVEPTPMQDLMITLWDDKLPEFSEVNIAASRRQGKTFSAAVLSIRELLIINSSTMVVSKSAKSVAVIFNEILRLLRVLGLKPSQVNSNQYSLRLNDSILKCTVYKTMETLLGNKASLIILDECGTYTYTDNVNLNLLPMRNDYGTYEDTGMFVAKIVRISSPREIGSDFFYDVTKGYVTKPKNLHKYDVFITPRGICSNSYSIYDSPLATPQLIESIKLSTDPDIWKTEFLSEFIHMNSISAFSMFNEDINTFELPTLVKRITGGATTSLGFNLESTPRLQGFIGLDVGYRDNSAIVIGTVIDNSIYILDGFEAPHLTPREFAEQIRLMQSKWSYGVLPLDFSEGAIYIDKTAAMMTADLNINYDIPAMAGFNKVREGISLINTAFKNKKLFINKDITSLNDQIKTLAFRDAIVSSTGGSSQDPFVRVKGHHFDIVHAFRYLSTSIMKYWGYAVEEGDSYEDIDYDSE